MDDVERIARRLKPHDVRVLMAVVEAGSMHKAAQRLRTSQSAISRAIADLEHSVGVRLLERSRHGIEPTSGELRIGCTEAMAAGPVLPVIEELTRQHSRLVFRLVPLPELVERRHTAFDEDAAIWRDGVHRGSLPRVGGTTSRACDLAGTRGHC